VLTGPGDAERLDLRRIVVAWKDTREARRALTDAMPLLKRAERVLVVAASERGLEQDSTIVTADVAEAIRRHGGNATTQVAPASHSAADAILEAAVNFDAQLIVAGVGVRRRHPQPAPPGRQVRAVQPLTQLRSPPGLRPSVWLIIADLRANLTAIKTSTVDDP
jgi:hypothetical protein